MTTDFRPLSLVLSLALVVRVAVLLPGFGDVVDPDNYIPIARSLAAGRGFALGLRHLTAYRPPLYPILLAPIVRLTGAYLFQGIAAFHLGLGLATVVLTYATARRWGLGPARATIASLIVAIDPVVVVWTRSIMTESLAAFLVAGCLASLTIPGRRGLVAGGFAFGLASLCRPSLLPGAGLYAVAIMFVGSGDRRRRIVDALIFSLMVFATLLPWAARNAVVFGEPVWTTTHGGHTLALANNPVYYADVVDGPPGAVWTGPNQAAWFAELARNQKGMTEPEADRFLRSLALKTIISQPRTFLRATVARLGRFWAIAPSGAVYSARLRWIAAIWTAPIWLALAVGLWRPSIWRTPQIAAPVVIMALAIVHAFYWTDMRMRVPIVPAIALVAAGVMLGRGKERMPG